MPFKRDLKSFRGQFERDGYILLKDILSESFMAYLKDFLVESRQGGVAETGQWRIGGKKRQYLFSFPSETVALKFRAGIAALTGMDESCIAVSERHLKQYEQDAPEYPAPHKDRGASRISIGLPIHLGPDTSVCVFPTLDRSPNPSERAVFMTSQDHPGLAEIYKSSDAVLLREQLGDMIVFLGSTIYHERIRPRGTAVLYIKINDEGSDPLGEDIYRTKQLIDA
ncbi:MAG: hypothetical protein H7X89_07665 [Rhizobiales bacterium]|nr:hypothetical protein [Hyphomicrobiales bacterium]